MNIKSSDLIKLNQIDMAHEVGFFIVRLFNLRISTPCI